jgi:hypothetical protein
MFPEPAASADFTIEITGVMPLPPANSRRSAFRSLGVNTPLGGSTSISVPAPALSQSQFEP